VIYTQDKDMRMVPGTHLDWLTHVMFKLTPESFVVNYDDKVWGRKWFWLQMLHGDTADNIPGLPGIKVSPTKTKLCGPVTAAVELDGINDDTEAFEKVAGLYMGYYGEAWAVNMLEQAILLWMRTDREARPLNVLQPGHPMHRLWKYDQCIPSINEIERRIKEASQYGKVEDDGDCGVQDQPALAAGDDLCAVPASMQGERGGAGPRSHNGGGESVAAQVVQCPAGQGREQLQAVRCEKPAGFPQWVCHVLAKAR
jgi:hypothetical protein